jgi:hypothetical protein
MDQAIKISGLKIVSDPKSKLLAIANVSINDTKTIGWKLARKYNRELVVYVPSSTRGKTFTSLVNVDLEVMNQVSQAIISAYEDKLAKPKSRCKDPPKIVSMQYNLLRHYYHCHKLELTALRIYIAARNIIDMTSNRYGRVNIDDLCNLTGINKKYLLFHCRKQPQLFNGYGKKFLYYRSLKKVFKDHNINSDKCLIREEKLNPKFLRYLKSNKNLKCYITKATMEKDMGKFGYSNGRISLAKAAEELFISPKTAFDNIKKSDAIKIKNIIHYPQYRFTSLKDFHIWLEVNQDLVVDKTIGDKVGKNPGSYFPMYMGQKYLILARRRPTVYKNTAFRQIKGKLHKKKDKKLSHR